MPITNLFFIREIKLVSAEKQVPPSIDMSSVSEEKEAYQADVIEQAMFNSIKDIVKQLKKARRDPSLKHEFT